MDEGALSRRDERRLARIEREDTQRRTYAYLPTQDGQDVDAEGAFRLIDRFIDVVAEHFGETAAPVSALGDDPRLIAQALDAVGGVLDDPRIAAELLVELQSFRPDDDWRVLSEAEAGPDAEKARAAAAERLRAARASATAHLRDDLTVVGDMNALGSADELAIGEGRRALGIVEAYRRSQLSMFMAVVAWPVGMIAGAVAGIVFVRLSIVALVVAGLLAVGRFLIGPFYGWAVGQIGAAVDNFAMRREHAALVLVGRLLADGVTLGLLFGGPALLAFGLAVAANGLSLP
jgi:hypothetical protein